MPHAPNNYFEKEMEEIQDAKRERDRLAADSDYSDIDAYEAQQIEEAKKDVDWQDNVGLLKGLQA